MGLKFHALPHHRNYHHLWVKQYTFSFTQFTFSFYIIFKLQHKMSTGLLLEITNIQSSQRIPVICYYVIMIIICYLLYGTVHVPLALVYSQLTAMDVLLELPPSLQQLFIGDPELLWRERGYLAHIVLCLQLQPRETQHAIMYWQRCTSTIYCTCTV